MGRIARVVVPHCPHHVTQRGNRRQRTFFGSRDYRLYKRLLAAWCSHHDISIWAYCLMPNHVHLILEPSSEGSLARAVGETHRRYTLLVNRREGWSGYLWQGRFSSYPMDEAHLMFATRYVLLNPVRAGLVERPEDWPHSSAAAHLRGHSDGVVDVEPLASAIDDWEGLLGLGVAPAEEQLLERHQRTGRPLGAREFLVQLEEMLGRPLVPRKPGPPPHSAASPPA